MQSMAVKANAPSQLKIKDHRHSIIMGVESAMNGILEACSTPTFSRTFPSWEHLRSVRYST